MSSDQLMFLYPQDPSEHPSLPPIPREFSAFQGLKNGVWPLGHAMLPARRALGQKWLCRENTSVRAILTLPP